ncbi:MAG: hypothetical protein H7A32_03575 [Deltaproteobacteria bacterium]|nr:hypothetical protein [Deltaproteobacteria bacterium]
MFGEVQKTLKALLHPDHAALREQLSAAYAEEEQVCEPLGVEELQALSEVLTRMQAGESVSLDPQQINLLNLIARVQISSDSFSIKPPSESHLSAADSARVVSPLWRSPVRLFNAEERARIQQIVAELEDVTVMDAEGVIRQTQYAKDLQEKIQTQISAQDKEAVLKLLLNAEAYVEANQASLQVGSAARAALVGNILRFELIFEAYDEFLMLLENKDTTRSKMLRASLKFLTGDDEKDIEDLKLELGRFKKELGERLDGKYMSARNRQRNFEFFFRKHARLAAMMIVLTERGSYAAARPFLEIVEPALDPWEKEHLSFLQQGLLGVGHDLVMETTQPLSLPVNSSSQSPVIPDVAEIPIWQGLEERFLFGAGFYPNSAKACDFLAEISWRYVSPGKGISGYQDVLVDALKRNLIFRKRASQENFELVYSIYLQSFPGTPKRSQIAYELLYTIYEISPHPYSSFESFLEMMSETNSTSSSVLDFVNGLSGDSVAIGEIRLRLLSRIILIQNFPSHPWVTRNSGILREEMPELFTGDYEGEHPKDTLRENRLIRGRRAVGVRSTERVKEEPYKDPIDLENARRRRKLRQNSIRPRGPFTK